MKVEKQGKEYQQMDAVIRTEKYTSCLMCDHMHVTKHFYISSEFAFKNTSASMLSGDKLALLRLTIFPASENTRSEGADVGL